MECSTVKKDDSAHEFFEMCDHSEALKSDIRATLGKAAPATTFDLYHTGGVWQKIAKDPRFENVTLCVICFNAIWMSIDTDWNKADSLPEADAIFQFMEHLFCFYFTSEICVRFMAFKHKCDVRRDAWFVFDSLLVIMMVLETWILLIVAAILNTEAKFPLGNAAVLRLLRLLRLSRLIRMLRALPELMILCKGMIIAMESVVWVLALLGLVCYVFAIACTLLSSGTAMGEVYFHNVPLSMYSLLVYATFLDNLADFCNAIRAESAPVLFVVFAFIALACLTLMNMLLGVLCEVINDVASEEQTELRRARISDQLLTVAEHLDSNHNGRVCWKEFQLLFQNQEALLTLQETGVDPIDVVEAAQDMFFNEDGSELDIPFDDFMDQVFELHEENGARIRDVKFLFRHFMPKLDHMMDNLVEIRKAFVRIEEKVLQAYSDVKRITDTMVLVE